MIKGLSDRRRLPRAGKIKLGVMMSRPGGKPYPKATDYFVVPDEIKQYVGDQPRELGIVFPTNQVDGEQGIFPQDYKMYRSGSGLYCKGNGEKANRWGEDGKLHEIACPCPYLQSGDCGPKATLRFFLPDVPGIGTWDCTTQSLASIISINSGLEMFDKMFGGVQGVPFVLKLEERATQRFDKQKEAMVPTTIYMLRLDSKLSLNDMLASRKALGAHVETLMLPPMDDDAEVAEVTPVGGSSEVERGSHKPEVAGSNPAPPTTLQASPAPPTTTKGEAIDPGTGEVGKKATLPHVRPVESEANELRLVRQRCVELAVFIGLRSQDAQFVFDGCEEMSKLTDWAILLQESQESKVKRDTVKDTLRVEYRRLKKAGAKPPAPAEDKPPARVEPTIPPVQAATDGEVEIEL